MYPAVTGYNGLEFHARLIEKPPGLRSGMTADVAADELVVTDFSFRTPARRCVDGSRSPVAAALTYHLRFTLTLTVPVDLNVPCAVLAERASFAFTE